MGRVLCLPFPSFPLIGLCLLGFIPGFIISHWHLPSSPRLLFKSVDLSNDPHRTILDDFQSVNNASPAWIPNTHAPPRYHNDRAIVTSLANDADGVGVVVLGHSITKARSSVRRIAIYLPHVVSEYTLCLVRAAGWELQPIDDTLSNIFDHGEGSFRREKYLKLWSWTLDTSPTKLTSIVYLAPNTIVRQNFDELFDLPFVFGAAIDAHTDYRGFTVEFNSGVMAVRPDSAVFLDMLSKVREAPKNDEQGFLNLYYGQQVLRLPHVYNGNLAIKLISGAYWDAIWEEMRIVQYTVASPFDREPVCRWLFRRVPCAPGQIWDVKRHERYISSAKEEMGGYYSPEIELWRGIYNEAMLSNVFKQCKLP